MANLRTKSLASPSLSILAAAFISLALIPPMCAQAPRQLQIEVGANQQVSILADDVSYGEILRALQTELGWEIEIPALADELKLSHVRVEAKQPQDALAELLAGSKLGYAFLGGVKGSGILKVVVIPSTPGESSATRGRRIQPPNPASSQRPGRGFIARSGSNDASLRGSQCCRRSAWSIASRHRPSNDVLDLGCRHDSRGSARSIAGRRGPSNDFFDLGCRHDSWGCARCVA